MCPWAAPNRGLEIHKHKYSSSPVSDIDKSHGSPRSPLQDWAPKFPAVWLSLVMTPLLSFFLSWSHFLDGFTWGHFLHLYKTFPTACFQGTHPNTAWWWLPLKCPPEPIPPQIGSSLLSLRRQITPHTKHFFFKHLSDFCFPGWILTDRIVHIS